MAWTAPRTWTDGELVTKTIMDAHVRDNFLAVGPHLIVRKTSDQSVTSSTALVDDTALQLTVAANEVWQFQFSLRWEAATTGDIKITWSFPASGRIDANGFQASSGGTFQDNFWSITTSDTGVLDFGGSGAGAVRVFNIFGWYIGAGTAGTVKLRWAQQASDATATKVLTHSTLWAVKLV